jgi:hypothetical protein
MFDTCVLGMCVLQSHLIWTVLSLNILSSLLTGWFHTITPNTASNSRVQERVVSVSTIYIILIYIYIFIYTHKYKTIYIHKVTQILSYISMFQIYTSKCLDNSCLKLFVCCVYDLCKHFLYINTAYIGSTDRNWM